MNKCYNINKIYNYIIYLICLESSEEEIQSR